MQVYLITNRINGKQYVGQTKRTLGTRWSCHKSEALYRKRYPLHRAIAKYGKEKFTVQTLRFCKSTEEMNLVETLFIALLGTVSPAGYNLTPGGDGSHITEATKKKLREKNKGKHLSPATEFKTGHSVSKKVRHKMRLAKLGKKQSPELIAKRFAGREWKHGGVGGYKRHKCRCKLCLKWRHDYYLRTGN
jgi:group I intron endonuclease